MRHKATLSILLFLSLASTAFAQTKGAFETPLMSDNLDSAAFSAWADGQATTTSLPTDGPRHVIWTQSTAIEWDGVRFGDSKTPGARFLRLGFKTAVPVGTVLTRGTVQVSVLKTTAAYPGRLGLDADWLPAHRLVDGQETTKEPRAEDYAVWTLPPGTQTRALRFTHTASPNEANYAGWLGGVFLLSERLANLAPQSQAITSANKERANLINNESNDGTWDAWQNAEDATAKTRPILSSEHPEWVTLFWTKPVALRGLCALWAGFDAADAQVFVGPATRDPRQAGEGDWRTVQTSTEFRSQYPRALGPNWIDFGKTITTRAVRLRITQVTPAAQEGHPHLNGRTAGGRRIWLGELLALSPLGTQTLASAILPRPILAAPHPPIPIKFTLKQPGYVSLVIEDAKGQRVRNLISETFYPHAGPNVAWWDGLDDLGRDPDAAHHGVYHVPGQFVAPAIYTVRGLTHNALDLHYEFSIYNAGNPAWETADGTGGWLTNHTPPSSALFVPGNQAPGGKPLVYLGSFISEGGAGLAWVDLTGRKQGGRGWIGGNWTAAPFLAANGGERPAPDAYAYVGAAWEGDLRLTALTPNGDRPVLTPGFKFPGANADALKANSALNGLAVSNGLLVASLPKQNQLLFADALLHRQIGLVSLLDPRGVAFDAQGRLLALSGTKLLRFPVPENLQSGVRLNAPGWTASASVHSEDAARALDGDANSRWSTNGAQAPGQWFSIDMKSPQAFSTLVLTTQADRDSPRGFEVYVSADGQNWSAAIAKGEGATGVTTIAFPRVTARYVKIVQTGTASDVYWSINALDVVNAPAAGAASLPTGEMLTASLEDPQALTLDSAGNIYVSDRGNSHQVKVFGPDGKFLRAIGKAGVPKAGPYDVLRMNNPKGLTIDANNHLWVAEEDFQPKRVSVWTLNGQFVDAFYGPARYGGGGTLDPQDKTRFYYDGMEFGLDWKTGKNKPVAVFHRPGPNDMPLPDGYGSGGPPETPLYAQGRQYMTDAFNSNPTNGMGVALLWRMEGGVCIPVAALGRANDWSLLKGGPFKAKWPQGMDLKGDYWANQALFVWSDLNGDGKMQPDEVQMQKAALGGVTVLPDLSFVESRVDDKISRFAPVRFTAQGVPVYDLRRAETLASGAQSPVSSGGDQALSSPNGWTIAYPPPKPFSPFSVGGIRNGVPLWSYPNLWPGLHAGHEAPAPDRPGELIATTRLLGGFVSPRGSDAGPLWAINGNMGNMYLMTADGLFVGQLFQDIRQGKSWSMPIARRDMPLNDISLHDENFFPSITQTADGKVYLVDGGRSSLVRVDGLDSLRRLPPQPLRVTPALLKEAQAYGIQAEALRQKQLGQGTLAVALRSDAPTVDGKLDDWAGADWATIDKSGVGAYFDSNSKPYNIQAALAVSGDKLYAAWKTGNPDLLRNTGDTPNAPFKTGGALDLMIGRRPGGERLLITRVKDKTLAVLYRAQVAGTKEPVPFSSPSRTITIDRVDDVSNQVQMAGADGNYEVSVPLALLGLTPTGGQSIKGDVGMLRGNGFQTLQRVYWNNKATGITADVPSEAMLTPELWGTWQFKSR